MGNQSLFVETSVQAGFVHKLKNTQIQLGWCHFFSCFVGYYCIQCIYDPSKCTSCKVLEAVFNKLFKSVSHEKTRQEMLQLRSLKLGRNVGFGKKNTVTKMQLSIFDSKLEGPLQKWPFDTYVYIFILGKVHISQCCEQPLIGDKYLEWVKKNTHYANMNSESKQ